MKNRTLRQITAAGVIAAAYAAISLVLAPITFGAVQCRVSEALTLLPVLSPAAVWGVTLGCAITNGVGAATGANFLGLIDLFVGTAATLLAAITSRLLGKIRFGGVPWLSVLPPSARNGAMLPPGRSMWHFGHLPGRSPWDNSLPACWEFGLFTCWSAAVCKISSKGSDAAWHFLAAKRR